VKVGVTLPHFEEKSNLLRIIKEAEDAGIDGLFAFDHLYAVNEPDKPTYEMFTLLSYISQITDLKMGTLVTRIGLRPREVTLQSLLRLAEISRGGLIAGLGIGDKDSKQECEAFGLSKDPKAKRLEDMEYVIDHLGSQCDVWIGGSSIEMVRMSEKYCVPINLWRPDEQTLKLYSKEFFTVAMALPREHYRNEVVLSEDIGKIRRFNPQWAVICWPASIKALGKAVSISV
jgi:hypothetical protein